MVATAEQINHLKLIINAVDVTQSREAWEAPGLTEGVPKGCIIEMSGPARYEWFISFLKKNPELGKFFRKSVENYPFISVWELIWQAQHLGIPTRLMDWTPNIETALFFAVENPEHDDFDGQFWVFFERELHDNDTFLYSNPFVYQKTALLNPSYFFQNQEELENHKGERNRMWQQGRFLFQNHDNSLISLEDSKEIAPHLRKVIIPKNRKAEIRKRLSELGFNKSKFLSEIPSPLKEEIKKINDKYRF